jgi:UDP-galactose transporter
VHIETKIAMPRSSDIHEPGTPEDLEAKGLLSPTSPPRPAETNSGNLLKWVALVALIIQNSGLAIVMRYTFLLSSSAQGRYIPSTAVLNAEIVKLIISFSACFLLDCHQSWEKFSQLVYTEMFVNYKDFLKLTIPSMLYTLQNSLQYFSMQCLSAPIFQVLYQVKIITTAIFSVILLSKRLSLIQWSSIVALTLGVGLVQLSQANSSGNAKGNALAGLISVILSCITSGFAGVYFEMVLKSTSASIWLRNIQLSLIGIAMSLVSYCFVFDYDSLLNLFHSVFSFFENSFRFLVMFVTMKRFPSEDFSSATTIGFGQLFCCKREEGC